MAVDAILRLYSLNSEGEGQHLQLQPYAGLLSSVERNERYWVPLSKVLIFKSSGGSLTTEWQHQWICQQCSTPPVPMATGQQFDSEGHAIILWGPDAAGWCGVHSEAGKLVYSGAWQPLPQHHIVLLIPTHVGAVAEPQTSLLSNATWQAVVDRLDRNGNWALGYNVPLVLRIGTSFEDANARDAQVMTLYKRCRHGSWWPITSFKGAQTDNLVADDDCQHHVAGLLDLTGRLASLGVGPSGFACQGSYLDEQRQLLELMSDLGLPDDAAVAQMSLPANAAVCDMDVVVDALAPLGGEAVQGSSSSDDLVQGMVDFLDIFIGPNPSSSKLDDINMQESWGAMECSGDYPLSNGFSDYEQARSGSGINDSASSLPYPFWPTAEAKPDHAYPPSTSHSSAPGPGSSSYSGPSPLPNMHRRPASQRTSIYARNGVAVPAGVLAAINENSGECMSS